MKSNKNTQLKTQIKIVKTLLDGSSKSQRQIAGEINKEESTVSKALFYLRGVIISEGKIIKSGGRSNKGFYKNNLCRLSYEVDKGIHVLNFFRNVLTEKTLSGQEESDIIKTLTKEDKFISIITDNKILNHPEIRSFFEKIIQFSPTFLKRILLYESFENFKKTWLQFNSIEKFDAESVDLLLYLELAKHSIINDGIEGQDTQKVTDYIKENKAYFSIPCFMNIIGLIIEGSDRLLENERAEQGQLPECPPEVAAKIRHEVEEEFRRMEEKSLKERGFVRAESA